MRDHLYLFICLVHFSTGCIVSNVKQTVIITGYTGGSVVLPCSCAHPQSTATTFTWQFQNSGNQLIHVFKDEKYSGRRVLFNAHSPTYLSLLITDLRMNDQGYYKCMTKPNTFTYVHLKVKGCIISDVDETKYITGYTGGSVVLPCSCDDPQSTATTFTWQFDKGNGWIPVFEDEKYSGRRVLFNERSPTNLSLLITHLRTNDQGYYKCMTEPNTFKYVHLKVKGCDLVENGKTVAVTGYSGESVVLPCSCTELLAKPEQIQWMYFIENKYKEIYPNEQIESHKNRVKLLNPNTPGNLSLHISALTTEDQGDYQCYVSSQQVVAFRLTVKEKPHVHTISLTTLQPSHQTQDSTTSQRKLTELITPNQHHMPYYVFILLGVFFSVLLLALLAFICWRCRGGRNDKKTTTDAEEQKKEQDNQDEVTYSAVVHVKTASTPAHTHNNPAEFTEYAPINVKR